MSTRAPRPRASSASLVLATLLTCGCDGSSRSPTSSPSSPPPAPAATLPRPSPRDASPAFVPAAASHAFVPADTAWRRALDEAIRRLDRDDPPARVAEVFGTVTLRPDAGIAIASTLPGASHAAISVRLDRIEVSLRMSPPLSARELESGVGPCAEFTFPDVGSQLLCPPIDTQRGTMNIRALVDAHASEDADLVIDYLSFDWAPTAPPPAASPPP